jgi:hypothetical protein
VLSKLAYLTLCRSIQLLVWVPVIRFMSCDLRVFIDQPAESNPSGNPLLPAG